MSIQSTIKETYEEYNEKFGRHFMHDSYESFLKQSQLNLLKAVVEKVKGEEVTERDFKNMDEEERDYHTGYNRALFELSTDLETIINELK